MSRDHTVIWQNCLDYIKKHISSQEKFNTWFKAIKSCKYEENTLSVLVPNQFFCEWLEKNYIDLLGEAIIDQLGNKGRLEYVVSQQNEKKLPSINTALNIPKSVFKKNILTSNNKPLEQYISRNIKCPNYTFENLIEGDFNRLVRSFALAITENPGSTSFNPFFIYGPVGEGKTHTLHAIANRIGKLSPVKEVLYTSSEDFTNFFIESIRSNNLHAFKNYFHNVDVLLIDDIQFFAGKEKTQEIFFQVFNQLYESNKQVIMTSDRTPGELDSMNERLISRFKCGIMADLQPPSLEARIAIIREKLKEKNIELKGHFIELIASQVQNNIREIEGVINSLSAHITVSKNPEEVNLLQKIISNVVCQAEVDINLQLIQKTVANYYHISLADIKGKSRQREIVFPRQIAIYLIRKHLPNHTLSNIGRHFNGRDHSTIAYSVRIIGDYITIDQALNKTVKNIEQLLGINNDTFNDILNSSILNPGNVVRFAELNNNHIKKVI